MVPSALLPCMSDPPAARPQAPCVPVEVCGDGTRVIALTPPGGARPAPHRSSRGSPCRVPAVAGLWDCRGLQQAAHRARAQRAPGGRGSAVTGVAGVGAQEGAGRRPAVQRRSRKASGLGATEPGLCFHRSKTYVTQNLPCNRVKCAALRCRSHHDHPHPKPEATEHF